MSLPPEERQPDFILRPRPARSHRGRHSWRFRRGAADLEEVQGQNIVALCDVDAKSLETAATRFPKAAKYDDYRKMKPDELPQKFGQDWSAAEACGLLIVMATHHTRVSEPVELKARLYQVGPILDDLKLELPSPRKK